MLLTVHWGTAAARAGSSRRRRRGDMAGTAAGLPFQAGIRPWSGRLVGIGNLNIHLQVIYIHRPFWLSNSASLFDKLQVAYSVTTTLLLGVT